MHYCRENILISAPADELEEDYYFADLLDATRELERDRDADTDKLRATNERIETTRRELELNVSKGLDRVKRAIIRKEQTQKLQDLINQKIKLETDLKKTEWGIVGCGRRLEAAGRNQSTGKWEVVGEE